MSPTTSRGLLLIGGFIGLLLVAALVFVEPSGDGARGALIGAGVGVVNLAVGYLVTRRSLQQGMQSVTAALAGGFLARLFVVVGLMLLFRRTGGVDPAAFALTFLVFFFAYLGLEMILVDRSLSPSSRGTAREAPGLHLPPSREAV